MLTKVSNPTKVLVIDDDPITRTTLVKILENNDLKTAIAADGKAGLSAYFEHQPDLILVDAMMPVMDGFDFIARIRDVEQDQPIPIIMLTALDDMESISRAFHVGATDFITKPINWNILAQRLKYILQTRKTERALWSSQQKLKFAQKLARLGYWEWQLSNQVIEACNTAFDLFLHPGENLMNADDFFNHVIPTDRGIVHQALQRAIKNKTELEMTLRVLDSNQKIHYLHCLGEVEFDKNGQAKKVNGSVQDVTRLHRAERLLHFQAEHDSLTKLLNRTSFLKELEKLTQQANHHPFLVISLDIDRFKLINASMGTQIADKLLVLLAQRLMQLHRSEDCIARLNGDEFAIMISKVDKDNLHTVLKRIMQSLNQPFMIDNQERFLSFSMGASVYGWHSHNAEGLLRQANIARMNAKHLGGHGFKVFESHMDNLSSKGFELENDLRKSLANNQIEVYYQPVVDARTYDIIGVEALLRWHHPTEGFISPAIFITLAETIGYIHELSQFVMSEAIKDCASWHAMGYPISVAINLSTRQFNESLLIAETHRLIEQYQLAPEFINLEITENLAMSNGEQTVSILKGLKALGVKIAIDDFGTGYSSLAYLHRFPIDTLKVDRSFVRVIDQKEGQAVAKTIVALAKSLGLKTVAEGIETKEQIEFMQSLDCDYFQGFIFAKPMPQTDLIDFLKNDEKRVKSF